MKKIIVGSMALAIALPALAQSSGHSHHQHMPMHEKMHQHMHKKHATPTSNDAGSNVLPGYQINADDKLDNWAAANERVDKAGGWKAYAQEIANDQKAQNQGKAAPTAPLLTLESALDQALRLSPGLRQSLATISTNDADYLQLSPHQREQLIQKARMDTAVKERYFAAVAAQEQANYKATVNEAAAVAAELALRMRKVGNLNFEHQAKDQLSFARTAVAWNNAVLRASSAKEQLALHLERSGKASDFSLPNKLPDLPHHFPAPSPLIQALLSEDHPIAGEASSIPASVHIRSQARQALHEAENAYRIARHYRDEILPLRKKLSEENLLRYNGMLIGVFDLLNDARHQIESVEAYLDALHRYWVADAKLTRQLAELKEDGAQFRRSAWTR
jgi:hypothetical protein